MSARIVPVIAPIIPVSTYLGTIFHSTILFLLWIIRDKIAIGIKKVKLIPCAGGDKVGAEREQWNDGTNTLCIAPGVVIVYDRNNITNQVLRENGLKVIEIPGAEISRGRGGPRCMSMPLIRED